MSCAAVRSPRPPARVAAAAPPAAIAGPGGPPWPTGSPAPDGPLGTDGRLGPEGPPSPAGLLACGPVADGLLDSRGAGWRLRGAGAGPAAASNGARGVAARPPARRTRGKPSPSVCVDTSRDSGGGDQSPA